MAEQALDVSRYWAQLRRHRLLVAAAVLAGAGAGAGSAWVLPPSFSSESQVLLPPVEGSGGETAERDVRTEIQVATSDVVLGAAGKAMDPPLSVRELEGQVRITAPTPDVINIVARARTGARAEEIARAVAAAELDYVSGKSELRSTTHEALLADREESLETSLADVTRQIRETRDRRAAGEPNTGRDLADASALAQLTAEQANLVLALDEVRGLKGGDETEATASVIQKASPARRPGLVGQFVLRSAVGAALAVLLLAMVLAVVGRRDRRLRFRDEVADALGTVVLASVHSLVPRTTAGWTDLLANHQPATVDAWALRQLLRQLASDLRGPGAHAAGPPGQHRLLHPASVTVISLAGDQRGLSMGPLLAAYAASAGVSTRLVAGPGHDSAAALWAACATPAADVEAREGLYVTTRNHGEQRDLTVVLAVADPEQPRLDELPETEITVLAVASGAATAEDLARVAVTVDDLGRRISGVVLADPDDLDRTTGRLLHHERAHQPALPAHLTGLTQPPRSAAGPHKHEGRA